MLKDYDGASMRAEELLRDGSDLESVLRELRSIGADKIDSIRIVKSSLKLSMGEAKNLVDSSQAWVDRFENDQAFHATVFDAAAHLRDTESDPVREVREGVDAGSRGATEASE